ncbi:ABC transporter substrate-binding protein [Helicobacter sp. MIT 01-3238]|nr:ABC transporter substrate-binding protein [Helicobacter sp. MIT 01-3238]
MLPIPTIPPKQKSVKRFFAFFTHLFLEGVFVSLFATLFTSFFPLFFALDFARAAPYIALGERAKYPNLKHFEYVNPNAPKGGTLKSYALGSFSSLNPFSIEGESASGLENVYDTLMAQSMDEPYSQYALIASDVAVASDNSSVIFTIDKRAHFADGVAVSAQDVAFSFEMMISRASPLYRQYYADVKEVRVLDFYRVEFVFKTTQNKELPLILGQLSVLPKHFYVKNGKNTFGENPLQIPLGSGPYSVKFYEVGKKIIYERNKNYWAKDLPSRVGQFNFDTLVFEYYRDDAVALQAFLSHKYDWRVESAAKVWARGYKSKALDSKQFSLKAFPHSLPSGMQGFFMNTRKEVFANPLVRRAFIYAFNFEWSNLNLFFSQYERTTSYFNHSIFASPPLPSRAESALIKQCDSRGEISKTHLKNMFDTPYVIPSTNFGTTSLNLSTGLQKQNQAPKSQVPSHILQERENLKKARDLLKEAGFVMRNGVLLDSKSGKPLRFTLLLDNPAFERLAVRYGRNLKLLGIQMQIQKIDSSQYTNRVKNFDYEMIVGIIGQSLFPGNEQRYFWSKESASMVGSRNYSGVGLEVVDCLIERVIAAPHREAQILSTHALDRVLLWGDFVVPHYYLPNFRVAFWHNISMPKIHPRYDLSPQIWWDTNARE